MVFTPVEWMALIFAIAIAAKLLIVLIRPNSWMSFVEKVYNRPLILVIISLIAGYVCLTFLIKAGIGIIQIYAVMLFLAFIMALSAAVYAKEVFGLGKKLLQDKNLIKRAWLALIVWIFLTAWVLKELLI